MGAWSWLAAAADPTADPPPATPAPTGVEAKLAAAQDVRAAQVVATREQAMGQSVVNRARDLICSTLGGLPFTVERTRAGTVEVLPPGWLTQPDPTRTRGAFVAAVTDDLFFHGTARCQVTVRDAEGFPAALAHMPHVECVPQADGSVRWLRPTLPAGFTETVVPAVDVVTFEGLATGVLESGGPNVLTVASRLDAAALLFAGVQTAGWLEDDPGNEPLTQTQADDLVARFEANRRTRAVAYLRGLKYQESGMDPSRLQLVEARSYQDSAVARVCNVPNYSVGVSVPGDSMTYKTAQTARLDLVDFGLAPFLATWEQTLSLPTVTPRGTTVRFDLEPFLRSAQLAAAGDTTPATTTTTTAGGSGA